jgi:hypothetical protein
MTTTSINEKKSANGNMATMQPAPAVLTAPNKFMKIETLPLYGILVSQKSYLLGLRNLAFQHHARFLAHRIIESRLPPELCDGVGTIISALNSEAAEKLWENMRNDPDARARKFQYCVSGSIAGLMRSEIKGLKQYLEMARCEDVSEGSGSSRYDVKAFETNVDLVGSRDREQRYVHLSASAVSPNVSMLVPGAAGMGIGGVFADSTISATSQLGGPSRVASEAVQLAWRGGGHAVRVLQVGDLEGVVRGWNQEFVEGFVEKLALKAVGGTKPELMMLQILVWR